MIWYKVRVSGFSGSVGSGSGASGGGGSDRVMSSGDGGEGGRPVSVLLNNGVVGAGFSGASGWLTGCPSPSLSGVSGDGGAGGGVDGMSSFCLFSSSGFASRGGRGVDGMSSFWWFSSSGFASGVGSGVDDMFSFCSFPSSGFASAVCCSRSSSGLALVAAAGSCCAVCWCPSSCCVFSCGCCCSGTFCVCASECSWSLSTLGSWEGDPFASWAALPELLEFDFALVGLLLLSAVSFGESEFFSWRSQSFLALESTAASSVISWVRTWGMVEISLVQCQEVNTIEQWTMNSTLMSYLNSVKFKSSCCSSSLCFSLMILIKEVRSRDQRSQKWKEAVCLMKQSNPATAILSYNCKVLHTFCFYISFVLSRFVFL